MHFIKSFHAILFVGGREEGCNFNVFTLICGKLQAAAAAQILHVCFNMGDLLNWFGNFFVCVWFFKLHQNFTHPLLLGTRVDHLLNETDNGRVWAEYDLSENITLLNHHGWITECA